MEKAIIFFTTTGNTQKMAQAIFDGMKEIDDSVGLFEVQNADVTTLKDCTHIALGCPACGDEELDDVEFKPFFEQLLPHLENKHIALFGSYGWGNQEWMESWEEEIKNVNANLFEKGFTTLEEPDAEVLTSLTEFGRKFANQ